MDLHLKGKLVLVTGSTAGIAFASARALAAEGARVIVNGRTEARVAEAAEKIRRAHPAAELELFAAVLSKARAAATALERFDKIDLLVNNLGVYEPRPFEKITDADWHVMIETNFLSGVRLSRGWLPKMKAAGWGALFSSPSNRRSIFRLQRFATVNEVAAMVTFLASPLSSATNGAARRGGAIDPLTAASDGRDTKGRIAS